MLLDIGLFVTVIIAILCFSRRVNNWFKKWFSNKTVTRVVTLVMLLVSSFYLLFASVDTTSYMNLFHDLFIKSDFKDLFTQKELSNLFLNPMAFGAYNIAIVTFSFSLVVMSISIGKVCHAKKTKKKKNNYHVENTQIIANTSVAPLYLIQGCFLN